MLIRLLSPLRILLYVRGLRKTANNKMTKKQNKMRKKRNIELEEQNIETIQYFIFGIESCTNILGCFFFFFSFYLFKMLTLSTVSNVDGIRKFSNMYMRRLCLKFCFGFYFFHTFFAMHSRIKKIIQITIQSQQTKKHKLETRSTHYFQ